jgi:acyl-CoA thioesterase-1
MRPFFIFFFVTLSLLSPSWAIATTKMLLIVGDSLTEGYGVEKSSAYPAHLEEIFRQNKINIRVINAGSSGSTTASAESRLRWHLKNKPHYLMIALGANDGLRGFSTEASYQNLKKALILAQSQSIRVILAGMLLPKNYGSSYRADFERVYTRLAKEFDVIFIPFLLEGVGGVSALNLADGIHPNEKGHKVMAEHIFKSIKGKL